MGFDLECFEHDRILEVQRFHATRARSWLAHWLACDLFFAERFHSGRSKSELYYIPTENAQ